MTKQVVIYCASSAKIPQKYFDHAEEMTRTLVEAGYGVRYGGGSAGLMGTVADTVLKYNGTITGVIPHFMVEKEWEHTGVANMIRVNTMHERKALLMKDSCAAIALPGGTGTMDELFDVVSLKKLGMYPHPVVLMNTDNFYQPLVELSKQMVEERFIRPEHLNLWTLILSPKEIVKAIEECEAWGSDAIEFAAV
ncbi:MAG: TIGR00730 family Rossman fold protein [Cytophagaceae bacterium]|jgi:uncharacterized protein (TIGR00730 family)|nr:TIGR00730 family Rossman fold protein [Cytophagaceae bacterium]